MVNKITISITEYNDIKKKAEKWENFCKKQASHLNNRSPELRSERARRAVQARWAKYNSLPQENQEKS